MAGIFDFIAEIGKTIISPITTLIDDLNTSDEEKMTLKNQMQEMNLLYQAKLLEYDAALLKAQSDIIMTEAQGQSWLQRNWRPLMMIWFAVLLGMYWFGIAPDYLVSNPDLVDSLFDLIKIGIGGYIIGRSGEKIVKTYKTYKGNKNV